MYLIIPLEMSHDFGRLFGGIASDFDKLVSHHLLPDQLQIVGMLHLVNQLRVATSGYTHLLVICTNRHLIGCVCWVGASAGLVWGGGRVRRSLLLLQLQAESHHGHKKWQGYSNSYSSFFGESSEEGKVLQKNLRVSQPHSSSRLLF